MTRQPFTVEDLLKMKSIGAFQISPDGSLVAYELKESNLDTDETTSNLWWVSAAKPGEATCLTSSGKDGTPSWSHDSGKLAFISGRGGKPQIYILDRRGGEAQVVKTTCRPGGALLWSPDDRYLAFTASIDITIEGQRYPGEPQHLWQSAAEELAGRAATAGKPSGDEKKKTPPVKVVTAFEYRNDGRGMTYEQKSQLFVLDLQDGSCTQLTHITGDDAPTVAGYTWSANDTLIYALSNLDLQLLRRNTIFYSITIGQEKAKVLFPFSGSVGNLSWQDKKQTLLFGATRGEIPQGTAPTEVWIWRRGMQWAISLTEDLDRSCRAIHWGSEGKSIYYIKEDQAMTRVYQRSYKNDALGEEILCAGSYLGAVENISVAEDGSLVYLGSDEVTPPQLYFRGKRDLMQERQLTKVNEEYLCEDYFCSAEVMHFKGPQDWLIEGFLMRPKGFVEGKPVPTVLSIHGGPTGAYYRSFVPFFQVLAHAGYAVVYINPRGSTGYGTVFTQGVCMDWGGGDYGDIMAGVDEAIARGVADPDKLAVTGWSYGGYMTCWAITQTERFKAAIGGANISNIYTLYGVSDIGAAYDEAIMGGPAFDLEELYMSRSAIRHVRKVTTPVMLLHGEYDVRCPMDQSEQFYTALKRLGKDVVFVRYPEQYHPLLKPSYIKDRWERSLAWFDHYLKGC
ncbi:MAG: S9 family peptidase [Symbiobacteriaceae bacterium]|nr:S9 family peptidase [Symbiobacteriaceae bacterium]